METTEKIVESYCRYVRNLFTIPNIKCKGQYEIDLLAININESGVNRYHIECGVSISGGYSKLTTNEFSPDMLKIRVKQAGQRRTLGYFIEHKFNNPNVLAKLAEYGFVDSNYKMVIVTWGATEDAIKQAQELDIDVWDFREIIIEIAECHKYTKTYFTDDTARTIQLFAKAIEGR
jgi:hypothetical protein